MTLFPETNKLGENEDAPKKKREIWFCLSEARCSAASSNRPGVFKDPNYNSVNNMIITFALHVVDPLDLNLKPHISTYRKSHELLIVFKIKSLARFRTTTAVDQLALNCVQDNKATNYKSVTSSTELRLLILIL
ncbi:hypothetical protein J6590_031277 [Homalodisca vitripennis]|nr:hypothetical protein J6590_031277 [Homalodisca vitripennis]